MPGALAAAVSNGGGLGLVGGARGDRDWLERELALAAEQTTKPWGVGFLSWAVDVETVEWALEYQRSSCGQGVLGVAHRSRGSGPRRLSHIRISRGRNDASPTWTTKDQPSTKGWPPTPQRTAKP
ncbi:MAG: nitronate monooxygenase [Pseudonocardiaceae bacterium]